MAPSTLAMHGVTVAIIVASFTQGLPACVDDRQCGWNSQCLQSKCECMEGFIWSHNKRDCVNSKCSDTRCLDCDVESQCRRCVDFIEERTGKCLDSCPGSYMLVVDGDLVGKVCPVREDGLMTVYIAIIIGVGAGIILTAGLALGFYCKMRKNRNKKFEKAVINKIVREQNRRNQPKITEKAYDNHAYATDLMTGENEKKREEIDVFYRQLAALRPYRDTLVGMISEAKERNRSLSPQDNRAYVYKNIIHQLCRVVTILNTDDSQVTIPADGSMLLSWADKILKKYITAQDDYGPRAGTVNRHSTFKPDHKLIPSDPAAASHNTHGSAAFTYERCESDENLDHIVSHGADLDSIVLPDNFTDPIEV